LDDFAGGGIREASAISALVVRIRRSNGNGLAVKRNQFGYERLGTASTLNDSLQTLPLKSVTALSRAPEFSAKATKQTSTLARDASPR